MFEEPVEVAGEVALEAAVCFASGFAFCDASCDVGDRGGVCAFACDEDHVQCAVEFAVTCSVEAVADRLAGGSRYRRGAGEPREGCFRGDAAGV